MVSHTLSVSDVYLSVFWGVKHVLAILNSSRPQLEELGKAHYLGACQGVDPRQVVVMGMGCETEMFGGSCDGLIFGNHHLCFKACDPTKSNML